MKSDALNRMFVDYHLPRFGELPAVGLFLEQTVKYVNQVLAPLGDEFLLTSTMVSNYVKQKIIPNPQQKTYSRQQIAYLIFITIIKNVVSLKDITEMFTIQKNEYELVVAYDYFCAEFENVLQYVFQNQATLPFIGGPMTQSKLLLKNTIMAIVYQLYLSKYLLALKCWAKSKQVL